MSDNSNNQKMHRITVYVGYGEEGAKLAHIIREAAQQSQESSLSSFVLTAIKEFIQKR